MVVHLLNYRPRAARGIKVRLPGKYPNPRLFSPDENRPAIRLLHATEKETVVEVPELGIYSIVVLE